MKRNIKIIIISGVVINLILIISGILFFRFYFFVKKIPSITGDGIIDTIVADFWERGKERIKGLPGIEKIELVNLVHIKKKNSNFEISCQFGPLYFNGNIEKLYPDELISAGRIRRCDKETARLIDEIAKTPKRDCRVPLSSPIPPYLNDYYMIAFGFEASEITPERAKLAEAIDFCLSPYKNLIGEKIPSVTVGIVDKRANAFYP